MHDRTAVIATETLYSIHKTCRIGRELEIYIKWGGGEEAGKRRGRGGEEAGKRRGRVP